jgi:spermidine synthase
MLVDDEGPQVVERRTGAAGEIVLRRRAGGGAGREVYEIIANGCFLMDTSDGRSERLLVDAALEAVDPAVERPAVLIGGLGVGFSLARAAGARWGRIEVVEREAAVVDWHRTGPLAAYSAGALDDPRVRVVERDLVAYLTGGRADGDGGGDGSTDGTDDRDGRDRGGRFHALCLDIDNGPDWTVTDDNGGLYGPRGLAACRERLAPGGVLAVWSAQPSAAFEGALRDAGYTRVRTVEVPVARGVPDVVHLAHRPG